MATREDVISRAMANIGETDWTKFVYPELGTGHPRVEWCGIFWLRMLHLVGFAKGRKWTLGAGVTPQYPFIGVSAAKPGDGLYMRRNNHHGIFVRHEGTMVVSIDGNAAADIDGDGTIDEWSTVVQRKRQRDEWAVAMSIEEEFSRREEDSDGPDNIGHPLVHRVERRVDPRWKRAQEFLCDQILYSGHIDRDPGPMTCTAIVQDWMERHEEFFR